MKIEINCLYRRKRKNSVALYKIRYLSNSSVSVVNLFTHDWFEYSIDRFQKLFYFYS